MDEPLISVVIPAYNHERYVGEAIRSVLEQDWPRIELVVIDDGSQDRTFEEMRLLLPECERRLAHVVMRSQGNGGTCVTLNRLLAEARGEYVSFVASDDKLLPGALRALVRPMSEDPGVGLAVGRNELMDAEGRRCYWTKTREIVHDVRRAAYRTFNEFLARDVPDDSAAFGTYAALLHGNHVPNGYLIRRSCLDRVLPFRAEVSLEDWWLHLQLSKVTRYRAVPEHTFSYRWHETNTIRQGDRMRRLGRQVLLWEEAHVAESGFERWADVFRRETTQACCEFSLGSWLQVWKSRSLHRTCRVLRVLGHEFVLKNKPYEGGRIQ